MQTNNSIYDANAIPAPPEFYAVRPYTGAVELIGRQTELRQLDDWAANADSHPILLLEAVGGMGKSLLAWHWASQEHPNFAGRFWYSFYERGAFMGDFCCRAVAYMTGEPYAELRKKTVAELSRMLLVQLQERPWLLILDGLERVLNAYHQVDSDDPYTSIQLEDDALLTMLALASPSKILIATRLIPRVLADSGQAARMPLTGLDPVDAEVLLRSRGVEGGSLAMQEDLSTHFDCNPLVTAVLAGIVQKSPPKRSEFQAQLAAMDTKQKRNHVLITALESLPEKSLELVSLLSLVQEPVDAAMLNALNPFATDAPCLMDEPAPLESLEFPDDISEASRERYLEFHEYELLCWAEHLRKLEAWRKENDSAPERLAAIVRDLELRGLLKVDSVAQQYDLPPVVRAAAAHRQLPGAQGAVDYFSSQIHITYDKVTSIEEMRTALHLARAYQRLGQYDKFCRVFLGRMSNPLLQNLEAHQELWSFLYPFFPEGYDILPTNVAIHDAIYLASLASIIFNAGGETREALRANGAVIAHCVSIGDWSEAARRFGGIVASCLTANRLVDAERISRLGVELVHASQGSSELRTMRQFDLMVVYGLLGKYAKADAIYDSLKDSEVGPPDDRCFRSRLQTERVRQRFEQNKLTREDLDAAEKIVRECGVRAEIRRFLLIRGEWHAAKGEWDHAVSGFNESHQLAVEVNLIDSCAEALLCRAQLAVGRAPYAQGVAVRLKEQLAPSRALAELFEALGDVEQAKAYARDAYETAWSEGEPYVYRYDLTRARDIHLRLSEPIPDLPPFDPSTMRKFDWEDEIVAAIAELNAQHAEKEVGS